MKLEIELIVIHAIRHLTESRESGRIMNQIPDRAGMTDKNFKQFN